MNRTGWAALVALSLGGAAAAGEPPVDLRSHELVRLDCASGELGREVTLFANGTVRIRDRGGSSPGMGLAELEEGELQGFQARLSEIDLGETEPRISGPSSETMEQCLLRLELTSGRRSEYRFPRMAALPLSLGRLLSVLDELVLLGEERQRLSAGLTSAYSPRVGDVLVKADGSRHRIVRMTADAGGVEIIGLESPLVLYLPIDGVAGEFVAIESRRAQPRK